MKTLWGKPGEMRCLKTILEPENEPHEKVIPSNASCLGAVLVPCQNSTLLNLGVCIVFTCFFSIDFRTPSRVEHCPDTESLLMAQEKFAGQTAWRPKGMTRRLGVYRNFLYIVVFLFLSGVPFKRGKVSSG